MLNILRKIWNFSNTEQKNIKNSIYTSVVFAIFHMLQIVAIYITVDGVVKGESGLETALVSFGLLLASIVGRAFCNYKTQIKQTHAGYFMVANSRIELGDKIKKAPMGYFSENNMGNIVGTATTVLNDVEHGASIILINILSSFLNTLVFAGMLLIFNWKLGLLAVAGILSYLWISSLMEKKTINLAPIRQKSQAELVEVVLEHIKGMHIIKAFNLTGRDGNKVDLQFEENRRANLNIEKAFTPYNILQGLTLNLFSILILTLALYMYIEKTLGLTDVFMMIITSFIVFKQIEVVGGSMGSLRVISNSIDKVEELKNMPQLDLDGSSIEVESRDIEFKNVDFFYKDKQILDKISFYIPENTFTAIVGPSGSGKTTMCKLISRFWDVDKGSISIGGVDIRDYSLESLMEEITIVFQDVYLFKDSVENNIKFGNPLADREEVIRVCKKACCHDFIEELPQGYKTIIGEGGDSLSGGQKQRLSIARAMLKDAPIVILDEATANIDPENERELQKAIEELTREKTVIVIAHKLDTIKGADQIIVLNKGEIEEKGVHQDLILGGGTYSRFVESRQKALEWKI